MNFPYSSNVVNGRRMGGETNIISEAPSLSSSINPSSRIICRVCQTQFSQYTCPRCNSRYCSLRCYKSHSLRCTESFMRDNVVEEMRHIRSDDETKKKMVDILKRFHSDDMDDSVDPDDSPLSESTIETILSGGEVSFDKLSPEERKCFKRSLACGELSKLIEPWEPWWLKPLPKTPSNGPQLIQPLFKTQAPRDPPDHTNPPSGPETPLPPLKNLTSAPPSPLLPIHLVDILYTYCFTNRLYNGECHSDPLGSAMITMDISSVLVPTRAKPPETVLEALSHCLERTCSPGFRDFGGLQFGLGVVDDVIALLRVGDKGLICALCDLQRVIGDGEKELGLENVGKKSRYMKRIRVSGRKVYFMICWVNERRGGEGWGSLAEVVRAEMGCFGYGCGKNKAENRDKVLIQEI